MASAPPKPRPRTELVLKWVAGITAVLSLIGGSFAVTRLLSDVQERKRFIAETYEVGKRQEAASDYAAAWATFEAALKSADEGGQFAKLTGQLSESRRTLRGAQQELAMRWLRNIRVAADRKFSEIVDRLLPVLDRGVIAASGEADRRTKADLLAHIGWAYYLKQRDGSAGLDPVQQYRAALDADPANPYAHAFWGHWLLSRGERTPAIVSEGIDHFEAAVKSGREREYVRALQAAALRNLGGERGSAELVRLVDRMRRNSERLTPEIVVEARRLYERVVMNGTVGEHLVAAVPPGEQIEVVRTVFDSPQVDGARINVRDAAVAMLLEAAGRDAEALGAWRELQARVGSDSALQRRVEAAIRRLTSRPAARTG